MASKIIEFDKLKKRTISLNEIEQMIEIIFKKQKNDIDETNYIVTGIPSIPILCDLESLDFNEKLYAIQKYINLFEYNFTDIQLSTYSKKKTFASMVDYAQILIRNSLPIRCLDAFILGAYLTNNISCIRFPLRFQSICDNNNKYYWHIVLVIKHRRNNLFGSIGISRKNNILSFKKCKYKSLLLLIIEFIKSYKICNHNVNKITIGLPLTNNIYSEDVIYWHILQIDAKKIMKYNNIFINFIKYKDKIFQSLNNETKPFLFDNNILFDKKNERYLMKQKIDAIDDIKLLNKSSKEHDDREDINRV